MRVEWPECLVNEAVRILKKHNPYLHEQEAKRIAGDVLAAVTRFAEPLGNPDLAAVIYREPLLTLGERDIS
jgi:hypothetical protein